MRIAQLFIQSTHRFTFLIGVCFSLCIMLSLPFVVEAQEATTENEGVVEGVQNAENAEGQEGQEGEVAVPVPELFANAGEDRNVVVGRTVLFDASGTTGPTDKEIRYQWDFGDGETAEGIDATHTYNNSGTYRVKLKVSYGEGDEELISQDEIIVSVQGRIVVLITDQSVSRAEVATIQAYALTQGVLVVSIRDTGVDQEYLTVQNLAQQIVQNQENIAAADVIITWTAGNVGLNTLIELSRVAAINDISLQQFRFNSKAIIAVNDQSLVSSAKIAQTAFQRTHPEYIIVSDSSIVDKVITATSPKELQQSLSSLGTNYQLITEYTARGLEKLGPFNFMSFTMNYMINKGVPINSLFLILMLPVMATIIAAARQIVGLKAFGIFAPTVIALSFLSTGLKYGVTVFVAIIIIGTLARLVARKFRSLYLPRMAIVLSILALSVFAMFFFGALLNKTGFIAISIFPILIMAVLTEHFISVQIQQGYKESLKLTVETLALSMIGYFIGDWTLFKTTILAYPELILITFVLNYIMGKFSGLRLTEYIRFRNVFKHARDDKKSK